MTTIGTEIEITEEKCSDCGEMAEAHSYVGTYDDPCPVCEKCWYKTVPYQHTDDAREVGCTSCSQWASKWDGAIFLKFHYRPYLDDYICERCLAKDTGA